jgi:hypothetical protein
MSRGTRTPIDINVYVKWVVSQAPALSDEQLDRIAALLRAGAIEPDQIAAAA